MYVPVQLRCLTSCIGNNLQLHMQSAKMATACQNLTVVHQWLRLKVATTRALISTGTSPAYRWHCSTVVVLSFCSFTAATLQNGGKATPGKIPCRPCFLVQFLVHCGLLNMCAHMHAHAHIHILVCFALKTVKTRQKCV